jgi:hypothetical protein
LDIGRRDGSGSSVRRGKLTETQQITPYKWVHPTEERWVKNEIGLVGSPTDGATNFWNAKSKHWTRWLGPEHRCVARFNSFSEFNKTEAARHLVCTRRDPPPRLL